MTVREAAELLNAIPAELQNETVYGIDGFGCREPATGFDFMAKGAGVDLSTRSSPTFWLARGVKHKWIVYGDAPL